MNSSAERPAFVSRSITGIRTTHIDPLTHKYIESWFLIQLHEMVAINGESEKNEKLNPKDFGYQNIPGTPFPPPLEKPPFTLKEIRDAIPPHCFERSTLKSLGYLTKDVITCLGLFYASSFIGYFPSFMTVLLWPIYWYVQGVYFGALWVLAHECGHGAFSDYKILNDTVGFVVHSCLLVPYYSWRITHAHHHQHTSSLEHDENFVPFTRSVMESPSRNFFAEMHLRTIELHPLLRCVLIYVITTILGHMPLYLIFNIFGPSKYYGKNANHFSPTAALFSPKQYNEVVVSNLGVFAVVLGLFWIYMSYGFTPILFHYLMPFLVLNFGFSVIVYLHHTDSFVPHFKDEEWSWIRGSLCTVDRSYGKWLDTTLHHITDTHVCHHLFPSMPFYHAEEATAAMTKVLGPYHLKDDASFVTAIWRGANNCIFVEDNDSIAFYKRNL